MKFFRSVLRTPVTILISAVAMGAPLQSYALPYTVAIPLGNLVTGETTLPEYIAALYTLSIWAGAAVFGFMIVLAGFKIIIHPSGTSQREEAKERITDAAIGMILLLLIPFILTFLGLAGNIKPIVELPLVKNKIVEFRLDGPGAGNAVVENVPGGQIIHNRIKNADGTWPGTNIWQEEITFMPQLSIPATTMMIVPQAYAAEDDTGTSLLYNYLDQDIEATFTAFPGYSIAQAITITGASYSCLYKKYASDSNELATDAPSFSYSDSYESAKCKITVPGPPPETYVPTSTPPSTSPDEEFYPGYETEPEEAPGEPLPPPGYEGGPGISPIEGLPGIPPEEGPTTTPPQEGPTTTPPQEGPTTTPPQEGPTTTPPTSAPTSTPPQSGAPTTTPPDEGPPGPIPLEGPPGTNPQSMMPQKFLQALGLATPHAMAQGFFENRLFGSTTTMSATPDVVVTATFGPKTVTEERFVTVITQGPGAGTVTITAPGNAPEDVTHSPNAVEEKEVVFASFSATNEITIVARPQEGSNVGVRNIGGNTAYSSDRLTLFSLGKPFDCDINDSNGDGDKQTPTAIKEGTNYTGEVRCVLAAGGLNPIVKISFTPSLVEYSFAITRSGADPLTMQGIAFTESLLDEPQTEGEAIFCGTESALLISFAGEQKPTCAGKTLYGTTIYAAGVALPPAKISLFMNFSTEMYFDTTTDGGGSTTCDNTNPSTACWCENTTTEPYHLENVDLLSGPSCDLKVTMYATDDTRPPFAPSPPAQLLTKHIDSDGMIKYTLNPLRFEIVSTPSSPTLPITAPQ